MGQNQIVNVQFVVNIMEIEVLHGFNALCVKNGMTQIVPVLKVPMKYPKHMHVNHVCLNIVLKLCMYYMYVWNILLC